MAKTDDYKAGRVSSVIGKKTVVEGTLIGNELLRIDGLVKGVVRSEGKVIIGNGGTVEGKVIANEIFVGGTIKGELFATGKVEANKTGLILGDIHTKCLIVDENAVFEGRCEMLKDEIPAASNEEDGVEIIE